MVIVKNKKRITHQYENIVPNFNNDRLPWIPAFILDIDKVLLLLFNI